MSKVEKKKLTLYVSEEVAKKIKIMAIEKDVSLSVLTETLFVEALEKENKA